MEGRPIELVLSDVDGTLVTADKALSPETIAAVHAVQDAGIRFAVTSSRPPRGMAMLVGPLRLDTPLAGFNGGLVVDGGLRPLEASPIRPDVARESIAYFEKCGVQTWLFDAEHWYVRDPEADYVARERRTVGFAPRVAPDFGPLAERAFKIVGVSADFESLERHEATLRSRCGADASVARSQPYYLDITDLRANKGHSVRALSRLLAVPAERIAVIGDGPNDVAMFRAAGFSIAMGNAAPATKAAADVAVEHSNQENGFAEAVRRYVLGPRAALGGAP